MWLPSPVMDTFTSCKGDLVGVAEISFKPFKYNASLLPSSCAVKITAEGLDTAFLIFATTPALIVKPWDG